MAWGQTVPGSNAGSVTYRCGFTQASTCRALFPHLEGINTTGNKYNYHAGLPWPCLELMLSKWR